MTVDLLCTRESEETPLHFNYIEAGIWNFGGLFCVEMISR